MKIKSQKTKVYSFIKLPSFAVHTYLKYKPNNSTTTIFGTKNLSNFNRSLKRIGEIAGFTHEVETSREKQGVLKKVKQKKDKTLVLFNYLKFTFDLTTQYLI